MRLARRQEIQQIETIAQERLGVVPTTLMDTAGRRMAEEIAAPQKERRHLKIVVLCGPGHNGGDGLAIARELRWLGFSNISVYAFPDQSPSDLWLSQKRRGEAVGLAVHLLDELSPPPNLSQFDLIVDALFGVGLNRPLKESFWFLVERMNKSGRPIVAVDVPSGLDADRGVPLGIATRATMTLTCGLAKPGFFLQEGPAYVGRLKILDIGFPLEAVREAANSCFLIGQKGVERLLPLRSSVANKTQFGKALLIGGQDGMEGALVLSGQACARIGAGYTWIAGQGRIPFDKAPPDFLQKKWKQLKDFKSYQAIGVGPGLGQSPEAWKLLQSLRSFDGPVVVDADGLNLLARFAKWPVPSDWILTPHAGEMSRILGVPAAEIEADRLGAVRETAKKTGAVVLLKGFRTVVHAEGKDYLIASGNVALAKAGSGDVLTGFISGLLAQGLRSHEAAVLGAYLHGAIADQWVRQGRGRRTLMASDLPGLLASLQIKGF